MWPSINTDSPVRAVSHLAAALICALGGLATATAEAPNPAGDSGVAAFPGVENPQRAWQNWTLNCQGCHRPDGTGSAGTAPSLKGVMARFLAVPGGREYLVRVPGVATSPLADEPLAELLNWMLQRFDSGHVPADFRPFTAAEVGRLRVRPLRLEAAQLRADLLRRAGAD